MGILGTLIMLAWAGAGVYDVIENGRKPVGFVQIFLAGPAFWVIQGVKWVVANRQNIIDKLGF